MKYLIMILSASYTNTYSNIPLQQNRLMDSAVYIQKAADFIRSVHPGIFTNGKGIVSDKIVQPVNTGCFQIALNDPGLLSATDRLSLQQQPYLHIMKWKPLMLPGAHLISQETIDSVFRSSRDWPLPVGRGLAHLTFSMPAFFHNGTYCLFYEEYCSGFAHGSYGHLSLYKQVENQWRCIKTYCDWVT